MADDMAKYLAGTVDARLRREYADSLMCLDFPRAEENLQKMIRALAKPLIPDNESGFSGYALHTLHGVNANLAVYTERERKIPADTDRTSRQRIDGIFSFKKDDVPHIIVAEVKFNIKDGEKEALQQIKDNMYVERAIAEMREVYKVEVMPENIRCIGINMMVPKLPSTGKAEGKGEAKGQVTVKIAELQ